MKYVTPFTGEVFPGEKVTDTTDYVERAGYLTIKQIADAMRRSGQVLAQTRAGTYDFLTEEDLHKSSDNFQRYLAAVRRRDMSGEDIDGIHRDYFEAANAEATAKAAAEPPVDPPVPPVDPLESGGE